MGAPPDWSEVNRRHWDERVPIHLRSRFYDIDGFRSGRPQLQPFETDELGPLGGLRLAHLQCHIGVEMLDLVRLHPGLRGVGLDFSEPAVRAAADLAGELDLGDRASFVHADVMDASTVLGEGRFDVVYTGKGALCWLSDLPGWAHQCARLLAPGGFLYVTEFHPVGYALSEDGPVVVHDYFRCEPWEDDYVGTYADLGAETVHNLSYSWNHTLGALFDAVIGAGLQLRFFHEWDYTLFAVNDWMVPGDDGCWRWPPGSEARLPMMYSLKAYKPT